MSTLSQLLESVKSLGSQVAGSSAAAQHATARLEEIVGSALFEDYALILASGSAEEEISIAGDELNTADAGDVAKTFTARLQTVGGRIHRTANFAPTVTPAESVSDGDVDAPAVDQTGGGTPQFVAGSMPMTVTFDTDAGATKTYQAGTKSTGDFTCVAKASVTDGGVLTLQDAKGITKTFEADPAGNGVGGGNIQVDLSAAVTDVDVADKYREVINAQADLRMTASGSTATVDLEQDDALAAGDTTVGLDGTMSGDGFTKNDFSGGVDRDSMTVTVDVSGKTLLAGVSNLVKTYVVVP